MNKMRMLLPAAALGFGALLLIPVGNVSAWASANWGILSLYQRDVRIYNNFADAATNNNQTPDPMYPGFQGAEMTIWKACAEWGSIAHGDGSGDPSQGIIGSGGANFDVSWQGLADEVGGNSSNIHSPLAGGSGGVLAYTEGPVSNGWRIRYYENWTWDDGPGTDIGNRQDLQSVACHEYGHALGLGHSNVSQATMYAYYTGGTADRSIHSDDMAGVQYLYGAMSGSKPTITNVSVTGATVTITGTGFSSSGNEVWFTRTGDTGNGTPVKVTGVTSGGTSIAVTIPAEAGPGDVLVRNNGSSHENLSNAWPHDMGSGGGCDDPIVYCLTSPNSVGSGALMSWIGSGSISADDFHLEASGMPANQFMMFYYGAGVANVPFGNGIKCVGNGGVGLFRFSPFQTDFTGMALLKVDYAQPPVGSGAGKWNPGDVWFCQAWYRDPAGGGSQFNLSDGLRVAVCE
jgi:hypothetical protein